MIWSDAYWENTDGKYETLKLQPCMGRILASEIDTIILMPFFTTLYLQDGCDRTE